MSEIEKLRNALRMRMCRTGESLRDLQELCGVSFATLSRFLRNGTPSLDTITRIEEFLDGKPKREVAPICVRRFKVKGKTFIVEIREEP